MKKGVKALLGIAGFAILAFGLSSCTASFCSVADRSRVLYTYDVYKKSFTVTDEDSTTTIYTNPLRYVYGTSTYWSSVEEADFYGVTATPLTFTVEGHSYSFSNIYVSSDPGDNLNMASINKTLASSYIKTDGYDGFWYQMDCQSLFLSYTTWFQNTSEDSSIREKYFTDGTSIDDPFDMTVNELRNVLVGNATNNVPGYGYVKYSGTDGKGDASYWINWDIFYNRIRAQIGADLCPTADYVTNFKSNMYTKVSSINSCIATDNGYYGYYGYDSDNKTEVFIEQKDWNYAWSKGFLEGLLIYPIGWLIDSTTNAFMGAGSGVAQMLAILVVTFLIRAILLAVTIKQTTGNAKMSEIQPEIAKIQAKYPNANTNNAERNAMASETQALYKKNKIHPFASILVMIVQFPVFICVWGAMTGSAVLSSGSFLGLNFSESVSTTITNFTNWPNNPGWWTAAVLFLIMAILQIVAMLLPQRIQKAKAKKAVAQTGKNPNVKSQNDKMKWFTIIMMVMIIFMGFSLASGMVVYWIAGSIFSIAQTLLIELINNRKKNKGKPAKKKPVPAGEASGQVIDADVGDVPSHMIAPTGKKKYKDKDKR